MNKLIKRILTFTLAVTLAIPTTVMAADTTEMNAAETAETEPTVEEVIEENNDITSEDIEDLTETAASITEELVAGEHTYTTSTSMANFAGLGYSNDYAGPISIVKATLADAQGNTTEVYVIGLSGTDFVENQATGVVSDLLAGFNLNNPYTKATVNAIKNNIPAGSNLIFCGHSLGGMVAQEAAANKDIKKNYNVMNTITFGAPLISGLSREGATKRLGDTNDLIPYLSVTGIFLPVRAIGGLNREDGGYGNVTNFWSAHMGSYCRTDVWGAYDILGYKYGSNTLTYDVSTVQYFKAPTKW